MGARLVPIRCEYPGTAVMAYLVPGAAPALIDTGGAAHPEGPIRAALRERGTDLAAIRTVVNTHGHWDHAGGNGAVVAASGAAVLIHALGAPLLAGPDRHLDGYATETARLLAQPELEAGQRKVFAGLFAGSTTPARTIAEGDRIELGDGVALDVLHLPGHAADHVGLFWAREGVLIAGDAAQGTGSRVGSGPLYFGSVRQARASLARLLAVPFRTLHVSHPFGSPGTAARPTAYAAAGGRAFLTGSLDALDAMEEALRAALRRRPEAPFPELACAATAELARAARWPIRPDPTTGVPPNAAPTFARMYAEMGDDG